MFRRYSLLLICSVLAWLAHSTAQANFTILHDALKPELLPVPGRALKLTVKIDGASNIDGRAKILATSDGRLMELPMTGSFTERDEVVFSGELWAPLAELNYQFVYYPPKSSPVVSQRFKVKRACIPRWEPKEIKIDPNQKTEDRVRALIKATRDLDTDNKDYEQIVEIVSSIVKSLNEEKKAE